MLDALLITFILVELLSAVRATLEERTLVAEPFILVGIIATIKELVVLARLRRRGAGASRPRPRARHVRRRAAALSVSAWLVRRKEREPEESDDADTEPARA